MKEKISIILLNWRNKPIIDYLKRNIISMVCYALIILTIIGIADTYADSKRQEAKINKSIMSTPKSHDSAADLEAGKYRWNDPQSKEWSDNWGTGYGNGIEQDNDSYSEPPSSENDYSNLSNGRSSVDDLPMILNNNTTYDIGLEATGYSNGSYNTNYQDGLSSSSYTVGNQTYTHYNDGQNLTKTTVGGIDFYRFSDGSMATGYKAGVTYNINP